jgi:hypothetical protein
LEIHKQFIDDCRNGFLERLTKYKNIPINYDSAFGHSGKIYGGHTRFYFTHENGELKKLYIEFNTCISIKKEIDEYYK